MSGFALEPVDGGAPIQLPPGETVLGRGPFLGVGDRRVSRNHGLLENQDGQLRLKPTHFNPCFVQSSLTDSPQALQKGSWHPLRHGDFFSLLPGQFIYKVVAVGGEEEEHTPRNSQMFEEEGPLSPQPDEEPPPPPPPPPPPHDEEQQREQTPLQEDEADGPLNQEEAEKPSTSVKKADLAPPAQMAPDRGTVTASKQRRRVLPAWMMAAAEGSSSSPKVVKKHKAPAAAAPSSKRAAAKNAPPAEASSPEEAELSEEEERPKKKRRKESKGEERAHPKTDAPSEQPALQAKSSRDEVSDESDSFPMDVEEEGRGGETPTADLNATAQTSAVSQTEKEDRKLRNGGQTSKKGESVGSNSSPAPTKPRRRTPCPYGKDCYRKNPLHFQESSHPGDTDYEEEEEVDEADLPECPYGTDCYRKNPLHRKEYKHTQKPASTMRTRPKKPPADDEDEEDGSEYEDSFINDDSEEEEEEGGDDSDYVPPASDDSEKEDIRRLQREAQAFLKKKK